MTEFGLPRVLSGKLSYRTCRWRTSHACRISVKKTIYWFIRIFADTGLPEKMTIGENPLVEQSNEV